MTSSVATIDHQAHERILVYDEEPVILDVLGPVLRRAGYQVTTTHCDEEAIGLMATQSFDLAVTDLGLHRPNGCRLVEVIRDVSPDTTVVAITAYPSTEVVHFAEEHAQAFLEKPFALGEFLEVVRGALERRMTRQRIEANLLVAREAPQLATGVA